MAILYRITGSSWTDVSFPDPVPANVYLTEIERKAWLDRGYNIQVTSGSPTIQKKSLEKIMARPNPKYEDVLQSVRDIKTEDPPWGLFEGIFGEPTVKTTPTQTPAVTVPQTGAQMQGGGRGTTTQKTECYEVYGNQLQLTQAAVDYYKNINVPIKKCGTTAPVSGNLEQRVAELEQLTWEVYPQAIGTTSQRSDVDIWNHLSQWVWGHGGEKWQAGGSAPKWDKPEPTAIVPLFSKLHQEQETRLTQAHAHRQSIETKVEDLYTRKSEKGHAHGDTGGTRWDHVILGVLAIVVILIIMKYVFPLLGGLKGLLPKRGNDSAYLEN